MWVVKVTDIIRTKAEPVDNNVNHFYFLINAKCSQVDWLSLNRTALVAGDPP